MDFPYKFVNKPQNCWNKVYFSNESKFDLFESDGINYVRQFEGEKINAKCLKKMVKFGGGSVMVFGMFSYQGTTPLIRLNTQVNATIYKKTC